MLADSLSWANSQHPEASCVKTGIFFDTHSREIGVQERRWPMVPELNPGVESLRRELALPKGG